MKRHDVISVSVEELQEATLKGSVQDCTKPLDCSVKVNAANPITDDEYIKELRSNYLLLIKGLTDHIKLHSKEDKGDS